MPMAKSGSILARPNSIRGAKPLPDGNPGRKTAPALCGAYPCQSRLVIHWGLVDRIGENSKSKGEEGMHTAALAWLLHGAGSVQTLRQRGGHYNRWADFRSAKLVQTEPESFAIGHIDTDVTAVASEVVSESQAESAELSCARFTRSLHPSWRLSSFSRLTSGAGNRSRTPGS